jgi:hypothetical protein
LAVWLVIRGRETDLAIPSGLPKPTKLHFHACDKMLP